ncbi:MAG: hypothetical protein PHY08_13375 [Candidatus Cloacimonetes bacterium]|nr:hypothetical protein [Candidatus Cloacimonadota bacterium]
MKKIILIIAMLTIMFVSLSAQNKAVYGSVKERVCIGGQLGYKGVFTGVYVLCYDENDNLICTEFTYTNPDTGYYEFLESFLTAGGISIDDIKRIVVICDAHPRIREIPNYIGNHMISWTLNDTIY